MTKLQKMMLVTLMTLSSGLICSEVSAQSFGSLEQIANFNAQLNALRGTPVIQQPTQPPVVSYPIVEQYPFYPAPNYIEYFPPIYPTAPSFPIVNGCINGNCGNVNNCPNGICPLR